MRTINRQVAAGAIAIGLLGYVERAAAQSLASATTPAAVTARAMPQASLIAATPLATSGSGGSSPFAQASATPAAATEKPAAAVIPAAGAPASTTANSATTVAAPAAFSSIHPSPGVQTAALIVPIKHVDETAVSQELYDHASGDLRADSVSWSLHVFKSRHRTELYFKGRLFRVYHAVFGRSRFGGGKEWEGDSRTPEGAYLITVKRRSTRFAWFLKLNYPNAVDQDHFAQLRSTHEISAGVREGGQVGIHGTDSPYLNVSDVNWTLGCISVANNDIDEMARLLPVGTLVVINP